MELQIKPITRDQAAEYTYWAYEPPYDIYNFTEEQRSFEIEAMSKPESKTYAVICNKEFIGIRSFGDDGKVSGGIYDDSYQDTGGALKPEYTGRGLGESVMKAGLLFGLSAYGYYRYRVTVAAFNRRALTVCSRIGFEEQQRFDRAHDGLEFMVLTLESIRQNK